MTRPASGWPRLDDDRLPLGTTTERAVAIEAACRMAVQLLADLPGRAQRLQHVDPVPSSTRALLRRLAAR